MMKNKKPKFSFKDKEQATKTLLLLESYDLTYRKHKVHGLLNRAKHVLSVTKAERKAKYTQQAIEVFEKWLEDNDSDAANTSAKSDDDNKVKVVPGLGFRDKAAAEATLKILEGRDPDYQKLSISSLITTARSVLRSTKNANKIKSLTMGLQVLKDFVEKFDREELIKNKRPYLPYAIIEKLPPPKDPLAAEFLAVYGGTKAKNNYRHLRTMFPKDDDSKSWDIIRNREIEKILMEIKNNQDSLCDEETGAPTEIHLQLIHWAYTMLPKNLQYYMEQLTDKAADKQNAETENSSVSVNSQSNGSDIAEESPRKKQKIDNQLL